jgi:hypothetical protein
VRATQDPAAQLMVARMAGDFLARDLIQLSTIAVLLAGAAFAFASSPRMRPALFAGAVLVLGMVDYYRVDRFILHPERFRRHDGYRIIQERSTLARYTASDPLIDFLRQREGVFRVFPLDDLDNPVSNSAFMSNRYMVFDIASVGGYHPAKLSLYDEFMRALAVSIQNRRFHLVNMVNARYLVSGVRLPDHPALTAVWVGEDYEGNTRAVYENRDAFPRAWVAGEFVVATGEDALAMLAEGAVDLRRTVILAQAPAVAPVAGDSAEVSLTRRNAREIALTVDLDRPGIVVVGDAYYPDWKATVDGQPTEVLRANHAFRAVALGAGRHEIVMRYDASLLRKGATISVATVVLTLLALLGSWVAGRRGRGEKGPWWKRSS